MKITCQSCQSKYTVSDEKVQGKTVKIKCRKCGATILVNSGGVTTSGGTFADPVSLSTGGAVDGGASYLVNVTDGDQRSMTLQDIIAAYHASVVNAETYVWADGMADWSPLGQVESIVSALNGPSPSLSTSASGSASASAPPPAVAAVAAAEPEHRVAARRDPGRRAQDPFAARTAEEPVATSAPAYQNGAAPAARAPVPGPTGSREENSMLFSLSALTAKVGSSASPSSAPSMARATTAAHSEDSGIIDLKALAAAAASQSAQPSTSSLLPDMGLFPLGAPVLGSPMAAPPVVSPSTPPPKSKTPIFVGVGAVVAAAAIVGAFLFMKAGPPPQPAAPAVTEEAVASAAPTASATAAPTDSAVASAAPTTSASATPLAVAKGGRGGPPRGGGAPRGGAAAPAGGGAATAAAKEPPKKSGGCGCAAGDLMCAMKCSAH